MRLPLSDNGKYTILVPGGGDAMTTLLAILVTVLLGCTSLHPKNTAMEDVGEVAIRTALFPITLGFSELILKHERNQEAARESNKIQAQEAQRAYRAWYKTLPPEEKARADRRAAHDDFMLMQQTIIANQNANAARDRMAPMFRYMPPPVVFQAPTYTPRPNNCSSIVSGSYITMNCY